MAALCGIFYFPNEEEHIRLSCPSRAKYLAVFKSEDMGVVQVLACEDCTMHLAEKLMYRTEIPPELLE